MAYGYRRPKRRGYVRKQRFFNRRPYGGGGRNYGYAPRTDSRPRADINVSIGRARLWIWNNTDREIIIRPGEALTIRIVSEAETRFGHSIRGYIVQEAGPGPVESGPEERWEDWI